MAGNFPDVPGHRLAYDRDGSTGFYINTSNVVSSMSAGDLVAANDDSNSTTGSAGTGSGSRLGIIFSEPHDLDGIYWAGQFVQNGAFRTPQFSYSPDTTNGLDGTWTVWGNLTNRTSWSADSARTGIEALSLAGVRGIRFRAASWDGAADGWSRIHALHVYGSPSSGAAANRLRFWHPTLDQEVDGAHFDWGDVARSTVVDKTFRIKNPSATLTANSVVLSNEALTDTTPTNTGQHTFSDDGSTFTSSLDIGNLAPGGISGTITLRRTTLSSAVLSLWWTRLVASASSWS